MDTVVTSALLVALLTVFSLDASRKRREFLKKYRA
jgi:hypothetical protein